MGRGSRAHNMRRDYSVANMGVMCLRVRVGYMVQRVLSLVSSVVHYRLQVGRDNRNTVRERGPTGIYGHNSKQTNAGQ